MNPLRLVDARPEHAAAVVHHALRGVDADAAAAQGVHGQSGAAGLADEALQRIGQGAPLRIGQGQGGAALLLVQTLHQVLHLGQGGVQGGAVAGLGPVDVQGAGLRMRGLGQAQATLGIVVANQTHQQGTLHGRVIHSAGVGCVGRLTAMVLLVGFGQGVQGGGGGDDVVEQLAQRRRDGELLQPEGPSSGRGPGRRLQLQAGGDGGADAPLRPGLMVRCAAVHDVGQPVQSGDVVAVAGKALAQTGRADHLGRAQQQLGAAQRAGGQHHLTRQHPAREGLALVEIAPGVAHFQGPAGSILEVRAQALHAGTRDQLQPRVHRALQQIGVQRVLGAHIATRHAVAAQLASGQGQAGGIAVLALGDGEG